MSAEKDRNFISLFTYLTPLFFRSPLVPVFSFGEIELYEQWVPQEGSMLDAVQHWVKEKTGIAPVV